jgi:hypothetical protein
VNRSVEIADAVLTRSVQLHRVAAGLIKKVESALPALRRLIIADVLSSASPAFSIPQGISRVFAELCSQLVAGMRVVSDAQAEFFDGVLFSPVRGRVMFFRSDSFLLPSVLGASFEDYLDRFRADLEFKALAAYRVVLANPRGEAMVSRDFLQREVYATIAGLDALIRTFVVAVQNSALLAASKFLAEDCNLIQLSVLDNRTTEICREYADDQWTRDLEPVGHAHPFNAGPPRHWNCRSVLSVVFPGDDISSLNLSDWLAGKTSHQLDKLFGSKNVRLYRRGLLSLSDLVRQANRPLRPDSLASV